MEVTSILVFLGLSGIIAVRIGGLVNEPGALWIIAVAALCGYVLADFISGFVHWMADRYGTEETPLFGPHFVKPFREHHVDPQDITHHDFVETNGNNCLVSLPFLFAGSLWPVDAGSLLAMFGLSLLLFSMLAVMATNQFHKWAHTDDLPWWVRLLQRSRLILSTEHHDIHHKAPFDTHFCITTGWLNWLLQQVRFFEGVEWVLARVVGLRPGVDDQRYLEKRTS